MKDRITLSSGKRALLLTLGVFVTSLFLNSCSEENAVEVLQQEMTTTKSEWTPEIEEYVQNLDIESDIIGTPGGEPVALGCRAGRIFRDFANSPTSQNVPFYQSAIFIETLRADGQCNFPFSLNRPCLFIGSVTIQNTPGLSGNYRILAPLGVVFSYNNVSTSFTFAYGNPQVPAGVLCGTLGDYIFQAQEASTGNWINVAFLRLSCSNCSLVPADG
ncbi:MAG: hypothetical protein WBA74_08420 [Cyclobacteriaceae bacterium]